MKSCSKSYKCSRPAILEIWLASIFRIFSFLRCYRFWIWVMWLCPKWRFIKFGTLSISQIMVSYFSSRAMSVTLLSGTFSFPFNVIPFSNTASLIGLGGNSLIYSSYSFFCYYILIFFIFSCISSCSIRSCNSCSFDLAVANTYCITFSLNISFSPSYFAWALIATIITIHSSGEYFNSTS